jgi:hypothetical protein
LLQEAIWHLTEGDVNTAIDPSRDVANNEQVASDIKAVNVEQDVQEGQRATASAAKNSVSRRSRTSAWPLSTP